MEWKINLRNDGKYKASHQCIMTKSLMIDDQCIGVLEVYSTHASIIHQAHRPIIYYRNNTCYIWLQKDTYVHDVVPVWTEPFSTFPEKIIVQCNIKKDRVCTFQELSRSLCLKECVRGLDLSNFVKPQPAYLTWPLRALHNVG